VIKVLIADDDLISQKLLQHILTAAQYEVTVTGNGQQAWEILHRQQDIYLAILDWMMPGMDGVEVCRRLRQEHRAGLVYIILLTAKEGTKNIIEALQAGANDYITKPFVKEELLAKLKVGQRTIMLQTQITQIQKLDSIGQLASGIAHEINTPIQYIGDNAQFLQGVFADLNRILEKYSQLLDANRIQTISPELIAQIDALLEKTDIHYLSEEIPKALGQSIEGINHISRIVNAMRDFANPGLTDKKCIDINQAIASTITVSSNKWKYIADMVTEFDPALPLIFCLPAEFNQVILNLILNAADAIAAMVGDAAKSKGTITIHTSHDDQGIEIRISDTGCGIPENIRDKVFDPFFTTKGVGQGTGQGLTTSYATVKKHGGSIVFESETGKGTVFIIRLPINSQGAKTKEGG